ncbi:hypothetical protein C8R45DRAFT_966453, partial [Mycena sanguinolenta]
MRLHWAGVVGFIAFFSLEANAYDNEHHENFRPRRGVVVSRTVDPNLKPQIDAAVSATANLPHYFWTGLLPPFQPRVDSVEVRARDAAARLGGHQQNVFELAELASDTVANIAMPLWSVQDQGAIDTWTYASQAYANASRGVAYVFRGEQVPTGNVFDTQELPLLRINPAVTGVYQILAHVNYEEQPTLIWPAQTPATAETLVEYNVAVSCSVFSRAGLWQHQTTGTTTNYPSYTRYGWFYGGQESATNTGAFTFSSTPQVTTARPTQAGMASWIAAHPSFDVQFPTTTSWEPSSINFGNGWVPYATACPYGADIGKMGGLKLRALPAGDSITYGFLSTNGNGYRYNLQQVIMNPPWAGGTVTAIVDYIGSVNSGTMPDPENEGHSGAEIATIGADLLPDLSQNPNVIFLLAGTNDINNNDDIADAPARLLAVVDQITATLPTAALLVGTLPLNGNADIEVNVETFNYNITQELLRRAADGVRVYPVPMENIGPTDMADSLHPNDEGYEIMANCWFSALWQVAEWGWIDPATGDLSTGGNKEYCSTYPVWYPQGEIADGHSLGPNGGLFNCQEDLKEHDCGCDFTEPNVPAQAFPIPASGNCSSLNDNSTAVRFADLNGDGRAEYLWLDTQGATTAFLNLGSTQTGAPRYQVQFAGMAPFLSPAPNPNFGGQFTDLNGDGRAEYLWVHDDGSVDAWLNLGGPDKGTDAAKVSWFPAGTIATGIGEDGAGVRFADLNGDGRAEYLWIDENGAMTAYLNLGSETGGEGAANVGWLAQGVVATGPGNGVTRDNVILADINGDGRADYLTVTHTGGVVEAWLNGGAPNDGPNAAQVG